MELYDVSVDVSARDKGGWQEKFHPNAGDLRLKVLGFSAPPIRELDAKLKADRPEDWNGTDQKKVEWQKYYSRELAKAGLLDWENFTIKGEPVPYTPEQADEIIDDPRFEAFPIFVAAAMGAADVKPLDWERSAEKNSQTGSTDASPAGRTKTSRPR